MVGSVANTFVTVQYAVFGFMSFGTANFGHLEQPSSSATGEAAEDV